MGTPPRGPEPHLTGAPPEPVPVAFTGRTSTLLLQDPVASLRRQLRECEAILPPGWFIAAHYWDIESGGMDIEDRGHGSAHELFPGIGIPRDGGLADLLAEAESPSPRFAAVICEDIERSGRDTFNALKLERQLGAAGVLLFAADEPINVTGINATTILIRRVKQGVAEWFRLQIKKKAREGLRQHTIDGWNIGTPPYGFAADRVRHPSPLKAAQGRTKTRLVLDPQRAPVVTQIFTWRVEEKIGMNTIAARLNADPAAYPPPGDSGWTVAAIFGILRNPKYTGHMVFGRQHTDAAGHRTRTPPEQWLWSPQLAHPAIITREVYDAAQEVAATKAGSRDGTGLSGHAITRRTYVLRSRIRCRACRRRMSGITRTASTRTGPGQYTYYACHHDPGNPRQAAQAPDHPRTISIREDTLLEVIRDFFATRVFGPDRAALLAAELPATAAQDTARREKQATALHKRLHRIDTAENAHAREIEALAHTGTSHTAGVTALRTRIVARFDELEEERATIGTQLAALTKAAEPAGDPALLDALPTLTDIHDAPARLLQQLFQAFDIQLLYSKDTHQVTGRATITTSTPQAVAAIIADSDPDHPTHTSPATTSTATHRAGFSDPFRTPIRSTMHRAGARAGGTGQRVTVMSPD